MNNQNKGEAMEAKVIKTWRERLPKGAGLSFDYAHVSAMKAEINDLRAALASAQEEIAKLRKGWISAAEQMPKDGETVLILCNDPHDPEAGIWAAQWLAGSETFESRTNGWCHADEVSHWMRLPVVPNREAQP